ncbi:hypothetical protein ABBQ32_003234 [Trebouxia sp. C0010 RCD-2024]
MPHVFVVVTSCSDCYGSSTTGNGMLHGYLALVTIMRTTDHTGSGPELLVAKLWYFQADLEQGLPVQFIQLNIGLYLRSSVHRSTTRFGSDDIDAILYVCHKVAFCS